MIPKPVLMITMWGRLVGAHFTDKKNEIQRHLQLVQGQTTMKCQGQDQNLSLPDPHAPAPTATTQNRICVDTPCCHFSNKSCVSTLCDTLWRGTVISYTWRLGTNEPRFLGPGPGVGQGMKWIKTTDLGIVQVVGDPGRRLWSGQDTKHDTHWVSHGWQAISEGAYPGKLVKI